MRFCKRTTAMIIKIMKSKLANQLRSIIKSLTSTSPTIMAETLVKDSNSLMKLEV